MDPDQLASQKPADLDPYFFLNQDQSGCSGVRVKTMCLDKL